MNPSEIAKNLGIAENEYWAMIRGLTPKPDKAVQDAMNQFQEWVDSNDGGEEE